MSSLETIFMQQKLDDMQRMLNQVKAQLRNALGALEEDDVDEAREILESLVGDN